MLVIYREGTSRPIASVLICCTTSEVSDLFMMRSRGMEGKASGQVIWVCPITIGRLGPARLGERRVQRKCISRRKGMKQMVDHFADSVRSG